MKFFIAGIMQGSKTDLALHVQDYRQLIKESLSKAFPDAVVYDPFEYNKDSLTYNYKTGKKVFLAHNRMCGTEIDVLVAFVPEATMGTAIELWEAWQNGAVILTISSMTTNWVVNFLSDLIFPDIASFQTAIASGAVTEEIERRAPRSFRRFIENNGEIKFIK